MLVPNKRQIEWYAREKTAFFHICVNTFTGREWGDGTEDPSIFNPSELNCRQWIRAIKETGFDAAILTAKHHDGFCLWPSKYTDHSVKSSPYKNGTGDIVREFTDACREFGIKAGIYLSPWDRHEKTWGTEAYNDFYNAQLTELLTSYGEIWECWWDGAGSTKAHYDWERWANTVRTLQPNAVIFGSLGASPYVDVRWVGNEKGIAGKPCYSTVDCNDLVIEDTARLNRGSLDGDSYIPAEADVSIRPGWFYHAEQDTDVRSPQNLVNLWFASRGRNGGLLLNIPPDTRGLLCDADIASLRGFHRILTDARASNLAIGSKINAHASADKIHAPENLLSAKPTSYYTPKDVLTPEIVLDLGEERTFNMFTLSEPIEYGNAVTGVCIEVEKNGEWVAIAEAQCLGNLFSERIPAVTASKVRVRILSALAVPKLYNFGLYSIEEPDASTELPLTSYNLLTRKSVVVDPLSNGWDINLGGIYPFNQLRLDGGVLAYEIHVFNGTDFECVAKEKNGTGDPIIYAFPDTVDWAYRLKITVTERTASFDPTQKPKLYLV